MSAQGPVRAAANTRDDWETPPALFDALNQEFHFTLDAAASMENKKASRFLTGPCEGERCQFTNRGIGCGLCASWFRENVWLNPPYGTGLGAWIEKAAREAARDAVTVMLLPANTDTAWFKRLWEVSSELRFLSGRVNFVGTTSSNTGGSVVAVIRNPAQRIGRPSVWLWDWKAAAPPEQPDGQLAAMLGD